MDITDERYMIALSEEGTITRAARRLSISQPALSNWLNSIEAQLGTPLIIRSRKQLVLTPAGQIYLNGAYRMLQVHQRVQAEIAATSGVQQQVITVCGTPNGGANAFSAVFFMFRDLYPTVPLQFIEAYNEETMELVRTGRADFGICSTLSTDQADLEYLITVERELVLMLPSNHRLGYDASELKYGARLPEIRLADLADTPFILPAPETSYYKGLMLLFEQAHIQPQVLFQGPNVRILYQIARRGGGATIVPRYLFSPLDPISPFSLRPHFTHYSAIICRKGMDMNEPQQALSRLLVEHGLSA